MTKQQPDVFTLSAASASEVTT